MIARVRSLALWCFENPRRGLITAGVIFAVIVVIFPWILSWIIGRLIIAVSPLISWVIILAIVVSAFRWILPKPRSKKK